MKGSVPAVRVSKCNTAGVRAQGDYVLYWMVAHRRVTDNFSLQRAADWSRELGKPLLILEALRCDYPWASDRLHQFVLQGMADNFHRLQNSGAGYYPFLEREKKAGSGLLESLADRACLVVTDDFPCFFVPRMVAAASKRLPVRLEKVDSNGLLPLRAPQKVFSRAYDFRRYLQRSLGERLQPFPQADPLAGKTFPAFERLPEGIQSRWPALQPKELRSPAQATARLPIDHGVAPAHRTGGTSAAQSALSTFLNDRLANYAELRNQPAQDATSELSPWLHFGHLSAHRVLRGLLEREGEAALQGVHPKKLGKVDNWWRFSPPAQAFLDQLVTWREIGFNFCAQRSDYADFESLPDWARTTLDRHAGDPRPYLYSLEEFENARTHDEVWNAAQRQLLREGRIHNYLRMLWGKKILHWTAKPEDAATVMIHLNDKYALDGRDPNSYSGIFWCLGRYDRAWGPERPVFGKIRYMSSKNTARKLRLDEYLARYAE